VGDATSPVLAAEQLARALASPQLSEWLFTAAVPAGNTAPARSRVHECLRRDEEAQVKA